MSRYKSSGQKKCLADFMQAHPNLANNFIKDDRDALKVLWDQLTKELNNKGPPRRDTVGWKKVWADWKNYIRKKVSQNTAKGYPKCFLTTSEDMIAKLCGFYNMATFSNVLNNESTENNLFKSDETEIEVVWSDEITDPDKEVESVWSEDISASKTIEEPSQHSEQPGDNTNSDERSFKYETADAESFLLEEEIAASSTAICSSPPRKNKHETATLQSVQKHMASEVNAMHSIADCMKEFLKYSQDNTQVLEVSNNSLCRVNASLEKLTELIAEQNALIDARNKDQRNHFMVMQRNAAENIKIKEKLLEIETLKFKRDYRPLTGVIKKQKTTKKSCRDK